MDKRWTLKSLPDTDIVTSLQDNLGVSEVIATLLAQRSVTDFEQAKIFFRPELSHLHDPFLMMDMDKAVQRLSNAIEQQEKILVYGDYDVDGTTAVSLMYLFLTKFTNKVAYYIPDRYNEGYGVSYKGIEYAQSNGFTLVLCLDCGIKAIEKVAYAKSIGIDFIICDHHRPGASIPNAVAVLDPKRDDCHYPFDELSGCGVGFKLIQAYYQQHDLSFEDLIPMLDLVVISIAADIVPMVGENRTLSYFGLKQLNSSARCGLKALMQLSNRNEVFNISDIVFGIAPRINAAGRIEHGNKAVELLIQEDFSLAKAQAEYIDKHNSSRKELDHTISKQALEMVIPNAKSTVVYSANWHKGVVGIVASRIIETHYRPTIVLTESHGKWTGSARSVIGFDVYDAIDQCSDLLEQFGGHKYAAGLTLKKENLQAFIERFEKVVCESISDELLIPQVNIDLCISLNQLTPKMFRIIQQMAPFGPSNPKPVFMFKGVIDNGQGRIIGNEQTHLKLAISETNSTQVFDGIAFGMAHYYSKIKDHNTFDVCFVIEENEWNGSRRLQLRIKDIQ